MPVYFHFLASGVTLRKRTELKQFVLKLLKDHGRNIEALNYIFCTDAYLFEMNKKYLNHSTYTDVITFDLSEDKRRLIADVYISIDRVRENARLHRTKMLQELHRVILHGALHLCGYTDKSENEKSIMRENEDFYLNRYLVSRETRAFKS